MKCLYFPFYDDDKYLFSKGLFCNLMGSKDCNTSFKLKLRYWMC